MDGVGTTASPSRWPRRAAHGLLVLVLTTACASGPGVTDPDPTESGASVDDQPVEKPAIETVLPDERGAPPAELLIEDVVTGDGAIAQVGDVLRVHYLGVNWSSGQQFDASWDRGQPYQFTLGAGGVIAGWDQGLVGMRVHGRRMLIVPPDLAYGARGVGGMIGPDETLVFVVDLLEVESGP